MYRMRNLDDEEVKSFSEVVRNGRRERDILFADGGSVIVQAKVKTWAGRDRGFPGVMKIPLIGQSSEDASRLVFG